jgi:hypothetical protein
LVDPYHLPSLRAGQVAAGTPERADGLRRA